MKTDDKNLPIITDAELEAYSADSRAQHNHDTAKNVANAAFDAAIAEGPDQMFPQAAGELREVVYEAVAQYLESPEVSPELATAFEALYEAATMLLVGVGLSRDRALVLLCTFAHNLDLDHDDAEGALDAVIAGLKEEEGEPCN